jgi:branched-chain amino acid transport system permease protein
MDISSVVSSLINGIVAGSIYGLVAVGFSLIFGVAKVMFFTHGEIYMLGAVAGYFFLQKLGMPYPLTIIIVMIAIGLLGLLVERFLRRLRGQDLAILLVTIALGMFIANAAIHVFGTSPLAVPKQVSGTINIFGTTLSLERVVIVLASAAIVLVLHFFNQWTKAGQAIRAVAQDREAAQLQGVDINRSAAMVFLVACGTAGAAGVLIAPLYYADVFLGTSALMRTFIVVIIGGLGSFPGAIAGGLFLGLIESFGYALAGGLSDLISFVVVILLLILRPQGLLGRE